MQYLQINNMCWVLTYSQFFHNNKTVYTYIYFYENCIDIMFQSEDKARDFSTLRETRTKNLMSIKSTTNAKASISPTWQKSA